MISVSWMEFQKIDGECGQDTHSQYTSVQHSLFTSAECTPRAWLKNCIVIFVRQKQVLSSGVSNVLSMVVLSRAFLHEHFLFFTYPTTHREHSVLSAHLQAPSVDRLRHQESLWREDLQSGGNPRTTTPKGEQESCNRRRMGLWRAEKS